MSLQYNPITSSPQKDHRAAPIDNKMTYEEILGPDSSLNDILNFDFAGRYQNKYKRLE